MRGTAQTSEPSIKFLYQLIAAIQAGELLIPRFQRPLVWKWDRQEELLRSVRDGIPMGAIMVWHTSNAEVAALAELAGHRLPPPRAGLPREYLLDGLQRLSTLFAALHGFSGDADAAPQIGYDLAAEAFVEAFDPSAMPQVLPLRYLIDSVELLRFQRGLKGADADALIARADELSAAFREYKVPVLSIASDELEFAVRTFNMVNHQGAPMDEADMIHAMSWSPDFELRERSEALRDETLQPRGWGKIGLDIVLKVVKASLDLDLYEGSASKVGAILRRDSAVLERAFESLDAVASLLREGCGIYTWELVPYSVQAVLLADALRIAAGRDVGALLVDWFWLTTHGEMFAGLSGYRLGVATRDLHAAVEDGQLRWSGSAPFRLRPIRASADFRAVRTKALALLLARELKLAAPRAGDPFLVLAEHGASALSALVPRTRAQASYSSIGNRFLCAPADAPELRARVLEARVTSEDQEAHLIPDAALAAAAQGAWDRFVAERLRCIAEREQAFVQAILARHPHVAAGGPPPLAAAARPA